MEAVVHLQMDHQALQLELKVRHQSFLVGKVGHHLGHPGAQEDQEDPEALEDLEDLGSRHRGPQPDPDHTSPA